MAKSGSDSPYLVYHALLRGLDRTVPGDRKPAATARPGRNDGMEDKLQQAFLNAVKEELSD